MFEGRRLGQGYELHWQPTRLCLTLMRSAAPLVLGAVTLDQLPNHIVLVRQGFRLQILVDERIVLSVIDPQTTPATTAWGFQAAGPMEGSTISLFDEQRALPATTIAALAGDQNIVRTIINTPTAEDHVWFVMRQALNLDAEKNLAEKNTALQQANTLKLVPIIVCGRQNSQNALNQPRGTELLLSLSDLPIESLLINLNYPKKVLLLINLYSSTCYQAELLALDIGS